MIDSEPIVTLVHKVMMTSSICLDLDCFELLSLILFKGKYYSKRLKNIFAKLENEPTVTPAHKHMMRSTKCLDLNYFELF